MTRDLATLSTNDALDPLPSALRVLERQPDPVFAVLDAARDDAVLATLRGQSECAYASLYDEDPRHASLAAFAPYLVGLHRSGPFLEALLRRSWAQSWGIFLTCSLPFDEVRRHLRRFLLVQHEDGRELYFRFYDPRVLRAFLPTCTPEQSHAFYGPIGGFFAESHAPTRLRTFARRAW